MIKARIVVLTGIFVLVSNVAYADEFMLPQSFSIDKYELPQPEETQSEEQASIKTIGIEDVNAVSKKVYYKEKSFETNLSLLELVRNFSYDYSKTLRSTMAALTQFNIKPLCYDSSKGQITARLNSGRELFILLLPSQEKLTHVRITPADGRYNLSRELIDNIFKNIERNLYSDINSNS